MEVDFIKTPTGIIPMTQTDEDTIKKWGNGEVVHATVKRPRNSKFHRKFFAMLQVGFEAWEPPEVEHNGLPAQKNFERFRKDVITAAGFYEPVVNLRGDVRAEAKSISFANMGEDEFAEVYNKCADVLLQRVLKTYTRDDLDAVVNELMGFL